MADERIELAGADAKKLWGKGRDEWNAWVADNPEADINFSRVQFKQTANIVETEACM